MRAAFADEAFALHFLQDSFAAGHVTGNWGNSAVRKGTHDYYSEHGVSLVAWNGHPFVALGDAYMRPEDAERTALAVRDSLAELIDSFAGKIQVNADEPVTDEPEAFDVCHESRFPSAAGSREEISKVVPVIIQTPVPALGSGRGELPRFRSELGPLIGLSTAVTGESQSGGFGSNENNATSAGGLDAGVRFGIGLEGVLDQSSDGLVFLGLGVRQDSPTYGGSIPGRGAIAVRWRAPFWLIPGDLIVAGPVLAFAAPGNCKKWRSSLRMAV